MVLDEPSTAFLEQLEEEGIKSLHEMTPGAARDAVAGFKELYGPGPKVKSLRTFAVPVAGGEIELRVYAAVDQPRAVLVYYHDGGWVLGVLDDFDTLARQLAEASACAVVLVDYRLAPEHRFPVAVEDAWSALEWADSNVVELAGGRVPLIVGGANLATIVARRARDASGPNLALQLLVYPVTDCDLERPSYLDPANQLLLTRDSMVWFWDHYEPDVRRRVHPDASPLRSGDLSALPPAVILIAEHDVLRDEAEAYAARLREAGVPVTERLFEGQMHGFFTLVSVLPGSADGVAYVAAEIDRGLAAARA